MTTLSSPALYWLPFKPADWRTRLNMLAQDAVPGAPSRWEKARTLAACQLSFTETNALDRMACALPRHEAPDGRGRKLAILSTSTTAHLAAGLRVGALRRGLALDLHEPDYGQYRQTLDDPRSALYAFKPTNLLFALDADTVAAQAQGARSVAEASHRADDYVAGLRDLWAMARERTGAMVIQQTIMPRVPACAGNNEHRLPASGAAFIARVNARLRDASEAAGIDLLALDRRVEQDGLDRWFSPASWHGAKQEVSLPAAPMYGDMVGRLIAARLGRSAKCCVFDLDNTLWGGVIGDEGLEGIVIGPGSAAGEAFLDVQRFALTLRARGILLAVCSKNDEANALAPFLHHPDMALRRDDIACFVANWTDKPSNLRDIARQLDIGLDALVFVDDNPFERELVRAALPEVFVPEAPEDPALVARCLSDSGCFEAATFTDEDRDRAALYAANAERNTFRHGTTDLAAYLAGLDMVLDWGPIDDVEVARVTQLINKTNQFNLATRRLDESAVRAMMTDRNTAALRFRLLDRFGDNGLIAVMTGRLDRDCFRIDDWLMSCRVLGRQVEDAMLNVLVRVARARGARHLSGTYRATGRNAMVADLLPRLGFTMAPSETTAGTLAIDGFVDRQTAIRLRDKTP